MVLQLFSTCVPTLLIKCMIRGNGYKGSDGSIENILSFCEVIEQNQIESIAHDDIIENW